MHFEDKPGIEFALAFPLILASTDSFLLRRSGILVIVPIRPPHCFSQFPPELPRERDDSMKNVNEKYILSIEISPESQNVAGANSRRR
jgi:hypothetical protein